MLKLKEKIDKCYQEIQNKYEKIPDVKLKDKLFVIIDKNNIAKTSNLENSLDVDDFKYALCFPVIEYSPQKIWYYSSLAPIIIDNNMSITDNIVINDWRFILFGQHLSFKVDNYPPECKISNSKFGFDVKYDFSHCQFNDIWDRFLLFTKINNIKEAEGLNNYFNSENKDKFLDEMDININDYTNRIASLKRIISLLRN